ncbi:beta-glucosidase [Lachnoclostridium sp. Marseille-P6806]|uniref:beta-glucosidase n=1 Tax=Lachnoclostridium sp. Marseille-P6806 TaxID=2364793 RepID=UPI0010311C75|nr:glycoside hydrolase family 3 N-terminal domain-containing protein [Lachnoclostridium sp. Marseille-P6806]
MEQYERDHLALVTDNAAECTVLLRANGAFPLEKPGKLAAFGSGLRYTVKGGTGSGEVNSRFQYSIEQSLEREGFEITTKSWLDGYDRVRSLSKKAFFRELKAEARRKHENVYLYAMGKEMKEPDHELPLEKSGDAAIYVLSRNSGEGSDREATEGDVMLSASELRDILALQRMYERFMLVLNVGGVVDLSPLDGVENILLLSQLGVDSGKVLADILTGRQNPSGKLTTTWAAWEEYSREGTFGDWNETRYNEGIYVGYRYFDTFRKKALFPFGYGLSYTSFASRVCSAEAAADTVTLRIRVKNTGTRAGKEVIQSYVSPPWRKLDKAYQELTGYAKTALLAPGAEEELVIRFALSDFASYDEEGAAYILEAGDYIVRVGNSSVSTEIAAVITLDETAVVLKTRNCLGTPDFTDIRPKRPRPAAETAEKIPAEAVRLSLRAVDIKTAEAVYDAPYEVDERVKALSDEELACLQIGSFDPDARRFSVIGNGALHVAGAGGETTSQLAGRGISPLVMADGPAGVRVARQYYEDEKGAHDASGGGMIPESMLGLMNPFVKFIAKKICGSSKPPKNAVIKEHAATMIPIGTAIAQSFNTELARAFGDLVGREMEMMGIHLWLAPALNIHRSILCGRNFEYYSEDPLVSGLTAAAVTEGVQAHKGCGTTIKHCAANNAETNRYCNNSQVSERAMREIYLRGFGICIRKSQPAAVMTSYNLLNGTHTSEHRGLIGDILRSEFGFRGIVMTDWVIAMMTSAASVHRNALSDRVSAAGGDLFMPGSRQDYRNVMQALKDGRLTREQLEINATRVLRAVDRLAR